MLRMGKDRKAYFGNCGFTLIWIILKAGLKKARFKNVFKGILHEYKGSDKKREAF